MTPERIAQDVVVSLHYKLRLDDGNLVEESETDDPLVYLHGHQNIIPGLESALGGMAVGEKKMVTVEAADAYGEYDSDDVESVPRSQLPKDFDPVVGEMISVRDQEGNPYFAQVAEVGTDEIMLDFNHPMAGKRLHFEVTITTLRAATAEELEHGHVHDGHHHH